MGRLFHDERTRDGMKVGGDHVYNITIQLTEECNLRCTYCYQHDKSPKVLKFEDAKKFIDLLLASDEASEQYIQSRKAQGVVLDFIGGEPFLEVDLMDQIVDYFIMRMIELNHPWQYRFMISMSSNGLLYFEPKVQKFINKHLGYLSLSITVDGNKELHDMCRLDLNGNGSYDRAHAAMLDWQKRTCGHVPTKITIAPANLPLMADALIEFATKDTAYIHCNYVYEEGWTLDHAKFAYKELKRVADYLLDHDLQDNAWIAILDQPCGEKKDDDRCWCGGTGLMMALDVNGDIYPCIRYTPSSIGGKQLNFTIGNVEHGFGYTAEEKEHIKCLSCLSRSVQCSNPEAQKCLDCPIETGCGDCAGYSYETYGTVKSRTTFICDMHIARVLASCYYRNKSYLKTSKKIPISINTPRDWAIPIIGEEEYEMLLELARRSEEADGKHYQA